MLSSIGCIEETKKEKTLPHGWKWHKDELFGVRLECPEEWEIGFYPYNPSITEFREFNWFDPKKEETVFWLTCKEVDVLFDLGEYVKEELAWPTKEIKNVKIDGVPGKRWKTGSANHTFVNTYVISNDKMLYDFFFVEEDIDETGYQILDSVKFGPRKRIIPSWEWYVNKKMGIRLRYPEKWEVRPSPLDPNAIEFKYFTSFSPEEPEVVLSIKCKKVKKDFNLEAYIEKQPFWPPDEMEDIKIDGIPGKQLKEEIGADVMNCRHPVTVYRTQVRRYTVFNGRLFEFFFIEDEIIGETGYQALKSFEFLRLKQ
jgi:hypothetical protein